MFFCWILKQNARLKKTNGKLDSGIVHLKETAQAKLTGCVCKKTLINIAANGW